MPEPIEALRDALTGRYRVERVLGAGGMATVYLAHDLKHDRPVALKVLNPELAAEIGTGRFSREIRFAARLQHPHICSVYDSGESPGLCWFTMPFVEGESLERRLERDGPLAPAEALRIVREAAQALAHAHELGVIHRDIKPANLLLTRDGSTLVADFGIARSIRTGTTGDATMTRAGSSPGTPAYMSPEQVAADRDLDGRTDIFSLGLVLHEILTGERPFGDRGVVGAMLRPSTEPPLPRSPRRASWPAGLDPLLNRALAIDREERYRSMTAFGADIEALRMGGLPQVSSGLGAKVGGMLRRLFGDRPVVQPVTPGASALPTSAAVLPFRDLSAAQDQTYFSDGLAEELTTALSRIPGLKVAGRSASFRFRGPQVDAREAGRSLGVGAVLSGSVRKSGDRLRIGAQLVNVSDGFELWSESYDRELADVFRVQDEIARAIVEALRIRLGGTVAAGLSPEPTPDLVAYDFFLQGRFAWHQRTSQTLPEAARCFEAAVERDPTFARAWAGLADACTLLPPYTGASPATAWPRAKAAAERAIALNPRLPDAHTSLAYGTMLYEWDWVKAEASFRRAIGVDPGYQIAHHWYADFLAGRERFDEALTEMLRARELDPLSRITGVELGWVYYLLGRLDEAEAAVQVVLRLDPSYAHGRFVLGMVRLQQGRAEEACAEMERAIELGGFYAHAAGALVAAQVRAGRKADAEATLTTLTQRESEEYVPPSAFTIAYAALGEMDAAFAALERGIREKDVVLPENFFEPLFAPLTSDPRYPPIAAVIRGS